MKIAFGYLILVLCGLAGGALFAGRHLLSAGTASTMQAQAFDRWQKAAAAADGQVDFKTREELLPLMAQSDGPRAWKMLTQTGVKPRTADMEQIAREWALRDGRAAVAFGQKIADSVERRIFLAVAYSCWFGREPQVFVEWLKTQPEREPIVGSVSYLHYGSVIKPEVASLESLAELYKGAPERLLPLRNLVKRVWERGHEKEAVKAWLRRQPASDQRDYAWRDIASDLAVSDPQAAAALAAEVTSPDIRRYLGCTVTAWMAKAEVEAALAHARSLPDEASRDNAWKSAVGTWLMNDPAAVLGYLKAHVDAITLEKLDPMMGTWMAVVPVESLEVLRVMKGAEETRKSVVESLIREWRDRSREDLIRWLESPAAEWLGADNVKRYRQMAEASSNLGGGGSRTIQGRRVWMGS